MRVRRVRRQSARQPGEIEIGSRLSDGTAERKVEIRATHVCVSATVLLKRSKKQQQKRVNHQSCRAKAAMCVTAEVSVEQWKM